MLPGHGAGPSHTPMQDTDSNQMMSPQGDNVLKRPRVSSGGLRMSMSGRGHKHNRASSPQGMNQNQATMRNPIVQILSMVQDIHKTVSHMNRATSNLQKDIAQLKSDVNMINTRQVSIIDQQRRNRNLMKRIWDKVQDEVEVGDEKQACQHQHMCSPPAKPETEVEQKSATANSL